MTIPTITSLQNERVKAAVKLRDRRGREKQQRMVIDGLREIARAQRAGVRLTELFYLEGPLEGPAKEILAAARAADVACLPVSPAVMEKLAFGERCEAVLAVAETPRMTLADFAARVLGERGVGSGEMGAGQAVGWDSHPDQAPRGDDHLATEQKGPVSAAVGSGQSPNLRGRASGSPLLCVVEGVEKPGNLGAILRTADGAGASGVIVADGGTDLFNPNAIRASLGAVFSLPVIALSSAEARAWLKSGGITSFPAIVEAEQVYWQADFRGPAAIVLGSEAHGLSAEWRGDAVQPIALPMLGEVDSLNVSNTAAILLYEAQRQRRA